MAPGVGIQATVLIYPDNHEFCTQESINFTGDSFSIPEDWRFRLLVKLQPGEVVQVARLQLATDICKNLLGMDGRDPVKTPRAQNF